jgi:hypothetical protein
VLSNDAPRPTFIIPRVIKLAGGRLPAEHYGGLGIWGESIPRSSNADSWWGAFEPLAVVLQLAGYDTPEIAFCRHDEPDAYLRILGWIGLVEDNLSRLAVAEGDWKAITGVERLLVKNESLQLVAALRVKERRWPERALDPPLPSPHPALVLDGPLPNYYVKDADTPAGAPEDPFGTPNDGWIVFRLPITAPAKPDGIAANIREARDAVAAALDSRLAANVRAGLVGCLDPATWDSPLQPALTTEPFADLAQEIWEYLRRPGELQETLKAPIEDPTATARRMLSDKRSVNPDSLDSAFEGPREALAARHASLYPREVNGPALLKGFDRLHWLIVLFALHEYGLIRLLGFPVRDVTLLPDPAVVGDLPPVELTGRYETPWSERDPEGRIANTTVQINQAGAWLDGWITDRRFFRHEFTAALDVSTHQPSEGVALPALKFSGTFDGALGGWIEIYDVSHPDGDHAFPISVGYALGDAAPVDLTVERRARRARLRPSMIPDTFPPEAAAALEPAVEPEEEDGTPEWLTSRGALEDDLTPLHSQQEQGMNDALAVLFGALRARFDGDRTTQLTPTATSMLAKLVTRGVLDVPGVPEETTPLLERFRRETRVQLVSQLVSVDTSYWEVLNDWMVAAQVDSQLVQSLLDLEPGELDDTGAADGSVHKYDFSIHGAGPGVSGTIGEVHVEGGGYAIYCPIRHLPVCAPPNTPQHGWPDYEPYLGAMLEGGVGAAAGAGIAASFFSTGSPSTLLTAGEWTEDDFVPSTIAIASFTAAGSAHVGVGVSGTPPTPHGSKLPLDGTKHETIVFISGRGRAISLPSDSSGWTAKAGYGVEVSVAFTVGSTLGLLLKRLTGEISMPVAVGTFDGLVGPLSGLELGEFPTGGWTLTPGQRTLLGRACARYRPMLENPEAILHIEADASTTGPTGANEILTWRRALATYAWIRALLSTGRKLGRGTTSGLGPGPDHVRLTGFGEMEARTKGRLEDEIEEGAWRRVKVKINEQIVVFL